MLTLLTGKPGAGKSSLLVERFILQVRQDKDPAIAKRPIYANITGLDVDAIEKRVGGPRVLPTPDDWRDTAPGALAIYDEAQFLFPATGKPGAPDDGRLLDLAIHRKEGRDLVFSTQDGTLVHHWLRKFVGQHVHLSRPNNMEQAIVYQWNKYQGDTDDYFSRKEADESRYSYNAETQALFHSATIHTHKFKMPAGSRWIIRFARVLVLLLLGALAWNAYRVHKKGEAQQAEVRAAAEVPADVAIINGDDPRALATALNAGTPVVSERYAWRETAATVRPIKGCVASPGRCRCFDDQGLLLDLEARQCNRLADGTDPMPINVGQFASAMTAAAPTSSNEPPKKVDYIGAAKSVIMGDGGGGGGQPSPQGGGPPATPATPPVGV